MRGAYRLLRPIAFQCWTRTPMVIAVPRALQFRHAFQLPQRVLFYRVEFSETHHSVSIVDHMQSGQLNSIVTRHFGSQ